MKYAWLLAILFVLSGISVQAQDKKAFELVDGDRVVFLGSALIEREQTYGYLETLLATRYADKNITFRNLGWAGDSVWCWARIGNPASARDGFKTLTAHIAELKPTIVFVCYGMSESFEGESGLPGFLKQYETVLDMLVQNGARLVMLTPNRHENLGAPLPDPAEHNKNLQLYNAELKKIADKRGVPFVDLFESLGDGTQSPAKTAFTENGIHLTAYGYWRFGFAVEQGLALPARTWRVELAAGGAPKAQGAKVADAQISKTGGTFKVTDASLAAPLPPAGAPKGIAASAGAERILQIAGLDSGNFALKIDGVPVATASAADWAKGVVITKGPDFEQLEKVRQLMLEKNTLYFHRWRPQNQTYIFGFRKKEQGRNAVEIPQFDPLIAEKEAAMSKLRQPVTRTYTIEKN